MFSQLKPPLVIEDSDAAFDSVGVTPDKETPAEDRAEMSMEEAITTHFIDQLIEQKKNSADYQRQIKEQNTRGLQQADRLRKKLGS